MTADGSRKRAKDSGLVLAGMGLNALLPGSGTLTVRLGQHVVELVTANRLARLEDFHRRVFEGDVGEDEITARFGAMEDADFQALLSAMLTDIEAEKVGLYSAVYIHLVENNAKIDRDVKRFWVAAASQLRACDFWYLGWLIEGSFPDEPADVVQHLLGAGLISQSLTLGEDEPPSGAGYVPDPRKIAVTYTPTDLGRELYAVVKVAVDEM